MVYTYEYFKKSADYVLSKIGEKPEIGIVLGSGLGPLAGQIENPIEIDYKDIPNFLVSTNANHAGKLIYGTLAGRTVICMNGRFHSYEGYSFEELAIPMRVFKLLGVQKVLLTNAAGAANLDYKPGDIMIIEDHLMFSGMSPMRGVNIPELGPRFFDISNMYDKDLIALAEEEAKGTGLTFHKGNYFFMQGPQFETPAEVRAIRMLGGDTVGMSTVTEALTAAHCGMPVLGFSVVTNMGAGILEQPLSDEEVREVADMISDRFSKYVKNVISKM